MSNVLEIIFETRKSANGARTEPLSGDSWMLLTVLIIVGYSMLSFRFREGVGRPVVGGNVDLRGVLDRVGFRWSNA